MLQPHVNYKSKEERDGVSVGWKANITPPVTVDNGECDEVEENGILCALGGNVDFCCYVRKKKKKKKMGSQMRLFLWEI